jgi:hypothetical protein
MGGIKQCKSRIAGRTRAIAGEKLNWRLPQCTGSSRDVIRFMHMTGA